MAFLNGVAVMRQFRRCPSRLLVIRPARSSTDRCLEMAGMVRSNGAASSPTVASPWARRSKMARRVGSASAAKVVLSASFDMFNQSVN